jgi:2-dehydropantoate 2-reductase
MAITPHSRIVLAGAGSVGCYLGGCLALAGRDVTLLLRAQLATLLTQFGLRVSDLDSSDQTITPGSLTLAVDPATAFANADIVLVTVKCHDTEEIARLIARHAPEELVVVSLQNGVDNLKLLSEQLGPGRRVIGGMIPFNVVQNRKEEEAPHFHRASSGTMQIGRGVEGLRDLLDVPGAPFAEHPNMDAVLWAKLLINLNNALNALSGLPLVEELGDRRWRLLLARQMREGFSALRAAGIRPARLEGVYPRLAAFAMRLRDPLFKLLARRVLAVDPEARSSMWEDLQARRPTEIDYIQGEIVRLAGRFGLSAPLNQRVMQLIKEAERAGRGSPKLSAEAVAARPL